MSPTPWWLVFLVLCLPGGLLEGAQPTLWHLEVFGLLPSNKKLQVPFFPPFDERNPSLSDYVCKLDHSMEYFTLKIDARAPGVISALSRDGKEILSRQNLTRARLAAGARTVFEVEVTDGESRRFTLVVERRKGTSLELLGLRPLSAVGQNFSVPYHPGELQDEFEAAQSFYEDKFVVEYDFADGGQDIECRVDGRKAIGDNAPSEGDVALHPYRYVPSFEQLESLELDSVFNLNSPGAGPTARCSVPIDTWRQIEVGVHIHAADKVSRRDVRLIVTRKGCARNTFYHEGACLKHCPTFHYPQEFNWRCGKCARNCEFCEHWHHCYRCRRNTTMYRYELMGDGTCQQIRVHAYRVYYDLACYLGLSCALLISIYCLVCVFCLCRRAFRSGGAGGGGGDGARGAALPEEREPLTGRARRLMGKRGEVTVGVGGLRGPAE